jgi:hypothetical protein
VYWKYIFLNMLDIKLWRFSNLTNLFLRCVLKIHFPSHVRYKIMKWSSFATLMTQGDDELIVCLCTVCVSMEKVCVQYLYTRVCTNPSNRKYKYDLSRMFLWFSLPSIRPVLSWRHWQRWAQCVWTLAQCSGGPTVKPVLLPDTESENKYRLYTAKENFHCHVRWLRCTK